jgi:hypothetical protein
MQAETRAACERPDDIERVDSAELEPDVGDERFGDVLRTPLLAAWKRSAATPSNAGSA